MRRQGRGLGIGLLLGLGLVVPNLAHAEIPYLDDITPGELRGLARNQNATWPYGYWEYLPTNFEELGPDDRLPLLVFLAGIGEFDNPNNCPGDTDFCAATDCPNNQDGLCRNLRWGPQTQIVAGTWDDTVRPFIFVSPQNIGAPGSTAEWQSNRVDEFLQFIIDNYPVDPRRIFLIGMSQGGRGVLQYGGAYGRRATAIAAEPGGGVNPEIPCNFQDTALWALHGEDDNNGALGQGIFSPCGMANLVDRYNNPQDYQFIPECVDRIDQPHPLARMTMFHDVGHDAWRFANNPQAIGFNQTSWADDEACGEGYDFFRQYTAANDSDGIYSWFLSLDRPDVDAPADQEIDEDLPETSFTATTIDDDTITYTWTQIAGDPITLVDADQATLIVRDYVGDAQYEFEVLAVDADGQWDRDTVSLVVNAVPDQGSTGTDGGSSGSSEGDSSGDDSTTGGGGTDGTDGDGTTGGMGGDETGDVDPDTGGGDGGTTGNGGEGSGFATSGGAADGTGDGGAGDGSGSDGGSAGGTGGSEGCGCTTTPSPTNAGWLMLLALAGLRRRRR